MTTAAKQEVFTSNDTRCWHRDNAALILSLEQSRPTVTTDVLNSIERALDEAQRNFAALIIAGSTNFAFGANLNDAFDATANGKPEVLDAALVNYQRVMLRLRHSSVPTIAAVRGVAISGGCELLMHCTRVVAHTESRIGLMEAAVGIVPGGGGLKEFALRAACATNPSQSITQAFETVATATLGTTAEEAQRLGFLTSLDHVNVDDPLEKAIEVGRALHAAGHVSPPRNPSCKVADVEARRKIHSSQLAIFERGQLTPHQFEINMRVAEVLCGGNASGVVRTEADFLALERFHLVTLAQMPLTQARIAHLRRTGKLLAN